MACMACGHVHDPDSQGKCWEATCQSDCAACRPVERRHERDYVDIRAHLRLDHGVQVSGSVRLATFMLHRALHERTLGYRKHVPIVPHTHTEKRA